MPAGVHRNFRMRDEICLDELVYIRVPFFRVTGRRCLLICWWRRLLARGNCQQQSEDDYENPRLEFE
jgi:hypothetical protein